jgi:hypothetical protein
LAALKLGAQAEKISRQLQLACGYPKKSPLGAGRQCHRHVGARRPGENVALLTDAGMKTMKSEAEFKAAWMAMKEEDRAGMTKECGDEAIAKSHDNFCKMTKQLGGAN